MAENTDPLVWKKKDYLYARQTAANVTSAIFEGKEISSHDFIDYAGVVFDWLFQEQDKLDTSKAPTPESGVGVPTPTPEQKRVLDTICSQLPDWDRDEVYEKVLNFSTEVAGVANPTYPRSIASVDKIVAWLKEN